MTPAQWIDAARAAANCDLRPEELLLRRGLLSSETLTEALADLHGAERVDLDLTAPDPRLIDEIGVQRCLALQAVPLRRLGGDTVVATARPDRFAEIRRALPREFGRAVMAICDADQLRAALLHARAAPLAAAAETRVAEALSCRFWYGAAPRYAVGGALLGLLALLLAAPATTFALLTGWAMLALLALFALKAAAVLAATRRVPPRPVTLPGPRPVVSVMVPLFREEDIAPRLVARLEKLTYPKELLDICLVTEQADQVTRDALAAARLPGWMRIVTVPDGSLKTKPRALNFALDFCRGSIIGIYDAEDAPDPDQIDRVVRRFEGSGPEVACLQGVLDFYNSDQNWLARCFTIEYASWFRVMLPGLERLGLVVPLGGTTLFLRRAVIEALGGWDAHNVTEDADLGVRLARFGYRTELMTCVTAEEANCRIWPWIKQRSRWIKGYAMTWSAHMRHPARLWRDLGPRRFFGLQVVFLASLSQFLLLPVLWSFWLVPLGLPHPLSGLAPSWLLWALGGAFILCEALNIAVHATGLWLAGRRRMAWWLPLMHPYAPLAALAAYKAVFEMIFRPFYWDKTRHGITPPGRPPRV
ncbi:glycosyltransferase [Actibacterium sp. MT2.3-13A]|uniref:glycosyltransferase family 2 protein n=1 Tax=Actibacterium sp. MT2.3-13A TaxID=2828332 RepID=UPI001BA60A15